MLGGAGSNPGGIWNSATTEANVDAFAANVVALLQPLGFDGVDLDWEDSVDYPSLVRLAQHLRAAWPTATITIPTSFAGDDAVSLAPAAGVVDAFMPMTYIAIDQWGGWTLPSPLTPLVTVGANRNSVDWVRSAWAAAGVPASQLVMGVGGFGLVWGDTNGDAGAIAPYCSSGDGAAAGEWGGIVSDNAVTQAWLTKPSPSSRAPSRNLGRHRLHLLALGRRDVRSLDDLYCDLWNNCDATAEVSLIFYETPQSMRAKEVYVADHGMKGMMFWTLSQMRTATAVPILEAIGVCSPTVSTAPPQPGHSPCRDGPQRPSLKTARRWRTSRRDHRATPEEAFRSPLLSLLFPISSLLCALCATAVADGAVPLVCLPAGSVCPTIRSQARRGGRAPSPAAKRWVPRGGGWGMAVGPPPHAATRRMWRREPGQAHPRGWRSGRRAPGGSGRRRPRPCRRAT
jgi:hypothetical protein